MLRRAGLSRRTPLPRGSVPLRRVPLRVVSAKRRAENRVRARVVAELAAETAESAHCPAFEAFPGVPCGGPVDPHEPLTRARGGSVVDPANIALLCRNHHDHIHLNPADAEKAGWLQHSWGAT